MAKKPFNELTKAEAQDLAKGCVIGAKSEGEIRENLIKAGFNGESAAITSTRSGPMFMAMIMVCGPHGEVISA